MKILKRNFEHRNVIVFLILSVFYLQAIYALSKGISFYGLEALRVLLKEHSIILGLVVLTVFTILKVKKHSDKLLLLVLVLITGKNFILLSSSFNKFVLVLNFLYLLFAFYFFVTWELQINKASYNPLFSRYDLEKTTRFQIKGKLKGDTLPETDVLITNIDENSCFLILVNDISKLDPKEKFVLVTNYEGILFEQEATVVSSYDQGLGMEFLKSKTGPSWSDLHKVCLERGLFV